MEDHGLQASSAVTVQRVSQGKIIGPGICGINIINDDCEYSDVREMDSHHDFSAGLCAIFFGGPSIFQCLEYLMCWAKVIILLAIYTFGFLCCTAERSRRFSLACLIIWTPLTLLLDLGAAFQLIYLIYHSLTLPQTEVVSLECSPRDGSDHLKILWPLLIITSLTSSDEYHGYQSFPHGPKFKTGADYNAHSNSCRD